MKPTVFSITLSGLLALLLVFGTTSKEYIHGFTGHQDTTSCHHSHPLGPVWDPPHHHCEFLSFVLSAFGPTVFIQLVPARPQLGFCYHAILRSYQDQEPPGRQPVRGPPLAGLTV